MKKVLSFALFCCTLAAFTSCSKSVNEPEATKDGMLVRASDSAAVYAYMVEKNWRFYEQFTHYCDTGTLNTFKMNRSQQGAPNWFGRMLFEIDNVYWETDQFGVQRAGNWYLVNGGNTVQIITDQGTRYITPTRLEDNRFEWIDSTCNYAFMIPEDYTPGSDTSIANMLTAHTWKYESYMINYTNASANVLYRENKSNNVVDLSLFRLTLNSNGTYTEIDQNGNTVTGTWSLNNGTVTLTNTNGTTGYNINVINNDRWEWTTPNFDNRGEFEPE